LFVDLYVEAWKASCSYSISLLHIHAMPTILSREDIGSMMS